MAEQRRQEAQQPQQADGAKLRGEQPSENPPGAQGRRSQDGLGIGPEERKHALPLVLQLAQPQVVGRPAARFKKSLPDEEQLESLAGQTPFPGGAMDEK